MKKPYEIFKYESHIQVPSVMGLIGGMSTESSEEYKQIIFGNMKDQLLSSRDKCPYIIEARFDLLGYIKPLMDAGNWNQIAENMIAASRELDNMGAEFIVIATNTIHKVADDVENAIPIPLLHIADSTAKIIQNKRIQSIGLLGTRFTMEEDFYKKRLADKYGIKTIIPNSEDMGIIHKIIFNELVLGQIRSESRKEYIRIIKTLQTEGAQCIILGCTEIGMLVKQTDIPDIPLFDTADIHANDAYYNGILKQTFAKTR